MWEEGEFHRNMMRHHEENQRREQEAQNERKGLWNYNAQNSSGTSLGKIKNKALFYVVVIIGIGFLIERFGNIILAIIVLGGFLVIYFIFRKKKNQSSAQSSFVFIGKDFKGRSVFENRNANGTSSMWKMGEDGMLQNDISDFDADKGKSCFKPSEILRRNLVALEKGLVEARDNNGELEKNNDGFVIYKDVLGNYFDNPDDYMGYTGTGKDTLSNGDVYEGDYVKGIWQGKGKYTQVNGFVYEGDFENGNFNGKGKIVFPNGDAYEGDFVDGKRNGKGKTTWADGGVHEGDNVCGKRTGKGKFIWPDGTVYEGDFVDDNLHGKGKLTSVNGIIKEGEFKDGDFLG